MPIDWKLLARPQADGCDTRIFRKLLRKNRRIRRHRPGPAGLVPRYFDRRVACVRPIAQAAFDGLLAARRNHRHIAAAERLLRDYWPEVHRQFGHIVQYICPLQHDTRHGAQQDTLPSCSGCFETDYGLIYATVEHPFTLAEALVHEMAHHKLFAIGIGIETAETFILNHPQQLYHSPIILDRKRPMPAVLHAQYSFIHILQFDIRLYQRLKSEKDKILVQGLIDDTLPKMQQGLHEIQRHVRMDSAGKQFLNAFYTWCEDVIQQAQHLEVCQ